jgi:hypothetical protein
MFISDTILIKQKKKGKENLIAEINMSSKLTPYTILIFYNSKCMELVSG